MADRALQRVTPKSKAGGNFAPPLDEKGLTRYEELSQGYDGGTPEHSEKVRQGMTTLIRMLRKFWETPRSKMKGTPHPTRVAQVTPLEDEEVERIWNEVPWLEELKMMGRWFDEIDPVSYRLTRNAAFHLQWYGKELYLDREPITSDQVKT